MVTGVLFPVYGFGQCVGWTVCGLDSVWVGQRVGLDSVWVWTVCGFGQCVGLDSVWVWTVLQNVFRVLGTSSAWALISVVHMGETSAVASSQAEDSGLHNFNKAF